MFTSEKLILLWIISLLVWIILSILNFIADKKKIKARELQAVGAYHLSQEIKKLNNRLDSYYSIKNTENEEQK